MHLYDGLTYVLTYLLTYLGLNKPCIYTMEDVFTKERSTGEYLTDAKSVTAFRAQLQRSADKNGGKMLGYDPQRGEWTIEVPHF